MQSHTPLPGTPSHHTARDFFLGDDGLRAGWSLLLFVLLNAVLSALLHALLLHLHILPEPGTNISQVDLTPRATDLRDGTGFAALVLSALVMSVVERRPFSRYGTPLHRLVPDLVLGLFWGFALLSALVAALFFTHHLAWDGRALPGSATWSFGLRWALAFSFVALFEEYLLRGYLQFTLARGVSGIARAVSASSRHTYAIGFWVSAFLFSVVLFAAGHLGNGGETLSGILAVSLAGLVFVFSLWRTASLWWAIGFHAAWDWGQTFFYGTPDSGLHGVGHLFNTHPLGAIAISGGSAGPEGSLLVIPTLLLALLVIHFTLPLRPRPLTPDQTAPGPEGNMPGTSPDTSPAMLNR